MDNMDSTNFLKETIEAIKKSGHKFEDVMFIGSSDGKYRMNWDKFTQKADFEYDSSYGSQKIAVDLIIYFKDKSYITRGEYDGSEWWEYNEPKVFDENDTYIDFDILGNDEYMWQTVEEMNNSEKYDEDGYEL